MFSKCCKEARLTVELIHCGTRVRSLHSMRRRHSNALSMQQAKATRRISQ